MVSYYLENQSSVDYHTWFLRVRELPLPRMYVGPEARLLDGFIRDIEIQLAPVINGVLDEHVKGHGATWVRADGAYFALMGQCMALANEYLAKHFFVHHLRFEVFYDDSGHLTIKDSITYDDKIELKRQLDAIAEACERLVAPLRDVVERSLSLLSREVVHSGTLH